MVLRLVYYQIIYQYDNEQNARMFSYEALFVIYN